MKTKTLLTVSALIGLLQFSADAQVTVASVTTNGLSEPYNVVVDSEFNLYVSDSANNQIVKIDASTQGQSTLAGLPGIAAGSEDGPAFFARFSNPQGLLLVNYLGVPGLLVSDSGNNLIRFVRLSDGFVTTLAGQVAGGPAIDSAGLNATFRYPEGMDQDTNGNVYIADFGNNAIRVMNLNDPALGVTNIALTGTTLFRPSAVAVGEPGLIWVADTGNQMVKLLTFTGPNAASLTSSMGAYRTVGTADSTYGPNARFNGPSGLMWLHGTGLLISDTVNNTIRLATNYPAFGANNYSVSTFAGSGAAGLVDGPALTAKLNSPVGLAADLGLNGFVFADLKNNAIRRIQLGPALPPVPSPQLGWVLFVKDTFGDYVSQLQVGTSFIFNNDLLIEILGTDGTETHFTFGPTPSSPLNDNIPPPSATVGSTPGLYRNGVHPIEVPPSIITAQPDVTIKAVGFAAGRQSSPIASARFQFKCGAPLVQGNNAALFTVTEQTAGAAMWYTIDGSDPTNSAPSIGPIPGSSSGTSLSIAANSNFVFKIRAFRDNYQPSEIVSQPFSITNFNANKITFGFGTGEASSDFSASPGQFFYAPVTLSVLQNVSMYSLQFSVTVTNSQPGGHQVEPGALAFSSALMWRVPNPDAADHKPPSDQNWYHTIAPEMFVGFTTNGAGLTNVPVFAGLIVTNPAINLIGAGWLARYGFRDIFDTFQQDLITYSIAHDTLFQKILGRVVVGDYAFKVPTNASVGEQYNIQIMRTSATSDGVGAPGSDVFIQQPTNATTVTVNPRSYIAGDVYPFRWFNAGDFGKGCLNNADVMQVFQTAVFGFDQPPPFSDFNAALDTCCGTGVTNGGVVYQQGGTTVPNNFAVIDGSDQTINYFPFGDGQLDVTDIYVTFRRSLDPSLTWWSRFWTTSGLAAVTTANVACQTNTPMVTSAPADPGHRPLTFGTPSIQLSAGDALASAGQTVQIPIVARINGNYPIRVLALNLTVVPLDGSPDLTVPVQFTPSASLGQPGISASRGPNNYVAAWLDSTVPGVSGTTGVVGVLQVTLPGNASASSAYAIHFDKASASPNGLYSFPKKTMTGLITLSDRSSSYYNDGIPDSWRLRYFGTVYNLLSQAGADADGDGAINMQEFLAGTDPTDVNSVLKVSTDQANSSQPQDCVIHWPTVVGKTYVIERTTSLFHPNWIPVVTNAGTGTDMEIHDAAGGNVRFYRVRAQ